MQSLNNGFCVGKHSGFSCFDKHTYQPDGPDAKALRRQSSASIIQQYKSDVDFLSQNNGFRLSSPEVFLKQCHQVFLLNRPALNPLRRLNFVRAKFSGTRMDDLVPDRFRHNN